MTDESNRPTPTRAPSAPESRRALPLLLEREHPLAQLDAAHAQVVAGHGGVCVLLSGDAGIGKTTLVHTFLRALPTETPVLLAGCEALFTPRPLGPLVDLAERFPPSVAQALEQGRTYTGLFPALLRHFKESPEPCVFVVEDVHWADVGTLDLLRYLGRRLHGVRLLMLLTYRDVGLEADHPLRGVMGDLSSATTLRLALEPLSRAAVEVLARTAQRDGAAVYAATAGNPFYVTEVLAGQPGGVPLSVRDAVQAALARLPPAARALAEWVSLFPGHVERSLLERVAATPPAALEACLRCGLLRLEAHALSFRHEIARQAIYDAVPALHRVDGHALIFQVLLADGPAAQPARLVHHAEAAGLGEQVAALAPLAARQAASTGSHREATRLYALALRHGGAHAPAARAELLEAQAHECMLTNRHRAAIGARQQARDIRRGLGDRLGEAVNLRWLARLHWFENGSGATSFRLAHEAIGLLRALPPHRELALAYSTLSHLHLVGEDMEGAQRWGLHAIELAEVLEDPEALCHALNNVGTARLRLADDALAWERVSRSLEIALQHGLEQDAARAYNNLFILCVMHHDFTPGLRYAEEGIAFCEAHGLDVFNVRIRIRRAFARIVMGQWELADQDLANIAEYHAPSPMEAATLGFVAAILALRRGESGAARQLEASVDAMHGARVEIWFITTAAALAEAAWLEGRIGEVVAIARPVLQQMATLGDHWRSGELAAWLMRAGAGIDIRLPELPRPYALERAGQWRAAADAWNRLGCPYDRALALTAGDDGALREALAVFEALGAAPGAERVRQMLRERGIRGVPRGPRPRTRDDPLGLTAREREIFELARQGLTGAVIASRLHRSERTVEHHLAAVYRKLGVASRAELMARHTASMK